MLFEAMSIYVTQYNESEQVFFESIVYFQFFFTLTIAGKFFCSDSVSLGFKQLFFCEIASCILSFSCLHLLVNIL